MGLRGPLPMSPEERAARGIRDRTAQSRVSAVTKQAWEKRAERLEAWGMELLERAMKQKPVMTKNNGIQMPPEFMAGHRNLDAADKIYARLGRITPIKRGPAPNEPQGGDDLAAFSETKRNGRA